MPSIEVPVSVSKEAHDIGSGLFKIQKAAKEALSDGWQPGQDLPIILTTAMSEMLEMLSGIDKVPGEWSEDNAAFMKAFMIPLADSMGLWLSKE